MCIIPQGHAKSDSPTDGDPVLILFVILNFGMWEIHTIKQIKDFPWIHDNSNMNYSNLHLPVVSLQG